MFYLEQSNGVRVQGFPLLMSSSCSQFIALKLIDVLLDVFDGIKNASNLKKVGRVGMGLRFILSLPLGLPFFRTWMYERLCVMYH